MADAPLRGVIFIPPDITFRSLYGLAALLNKSNFC